MMTTPPSGSTSDKTQKNIDFLGIMLGLCWY